MRVCPNDSPSTELSHAVVLEVVVAVVVVGGGSITPKFEMLLKMCVCYPRIYQHHVLRTQLVLVFSLGYYRCRAS